MNFLRGSPLESLLSRENPLEGLPSIELLYIVFLPLEYILHGRPLDSLLNIKDLLYIEDPWNVHLEILLNYRTSFFHGRPLDGLLTMEND